MIHKAQYILKKYFGYSSFKKGQEKIISSILNGQDVFAVMPTGGGKSICYQIPAVILPGITLVISPLISLMKDQVDALDNAGVPSAFINSSLGQNEIEQRITQASQDKYKILYVAPERLESDKFRMLLMNMPISLIAIDEAHCVSHWGHDFRPSYRSIASLINELPCRPVVAAFTATATDDVRKDVIKLLSLQAPNVYVTGFNRENLYFSVVKGSNKKDYIIDYLNSHKTQAGIIYTATRKETENLYNYLQEKGFQAARYHAGMTDDERNQNQEAFIYDNNQVMIATNAFGMGIDKSNVRYVIHYNMPRSMEAYYQEAGRAGRDGDSAECILLYGPSDQHIQKFLIEQTLNSDERKANEYKKLQFMVDYCHTGQCLRKYILEYFGEEDIPENCGNCGNCNMTGELSDITVEAQKIFSCIKRMGEKFGIALSANVLRGSNTQKIRRLGFDRLSTYGIMKEYTVSEITDLINWLIAENYLYLTEGQYPVVRLAMNSVPILQGREKIFKRVDIKRQEKKEDTSLFKLLCSVRKEISEIENVPPYIVFHDSTLKEMAKHCPIDEKSMLSIPGVGENKLIKYGKQFMETIQQYIKDHNIQPLACSTHSSSEKEQKVPSHLITYRMYKEGKSLENISIERDITIITIQDHLTRCGQEGCEVNWDDFIPSEHEELILQVIDKLGAGKLKPLKEALPDEIDYFTIRAVINKHS